MVYCVGLTGDIASGKTTVATLFSQLGIEIISADKISRELTQKDKNIYKKIVAHYGTLILNSDKELNRSQLREIIFSNPKEREWLEHLLHPLIRKKIKEKVDSCSTPYCVVEIPLLITKHNYPFIDRVLLITAPIETQLARVMQRDQCSKEQAQAILSVQPNMNLRLKNADDVVVNDLEIEDLTTTVNNLHRQYLQFSKATKS
ncbi:dephospho-CoA kinase [Legionella longbeachae]|uniref:Dephospho-CoA kinase n=1 Tax=Legionella longbeachae serogroup 1 (strain NSW150) TaxID=661367 RepID=D3HT71_LEGLN|nr:dephospho-CoA kinase [Legionella longbeachae]VEE02605.1 dephospho-CoA kinase [Legionella oakridgensis]HBD7397867.1 dephospho-CoA kinase [Legionella pneumophila]ARB91129.1 dephospho-CoA kinase [Legionella longbeachae]ARM32443.1 dephospho-CoA kinase [Legionella longbeachae]EEZ94747.1 dephospho-CoA kinase [Legionella longbeachae D-4968]